MGRQSRRRRTASTHRRTDELSIREVIYAAAGASREPLRGGGRYQELLRRLAEGPPDVDVELQVVLGEAFRRARDRHWDSCEVHRQAERRLGARHARYVRALMDGDGDLLSAWVAREGTSNIDGLACAVEVLALVLSLPELPRLGGYGGPAPAGHETRILEKVRALLAKAESTTFPEEAEALSAKAQELMARHAIDAAMVAGGSAAGDSPTGMRLPVDDPYAGAKSILLSEVASANRCRAVWSKGLGFSTVMGFVSDLMFVEILYTSLLVQATSAMVSAGSQIDRSGRPRTRSFRQAFLTAYATRIGHRLRAAEAASRAVAAEEYGYALLPVLADRSAAVGAARDAAFPGAVKRSVSVTNAAGWAAGSAAADLASLSGRTEVPASG